MNNRNAKTKLALTWIGKENRSACAAHADMPKLSLPTARQAEPRILLEDSEKSCHAANRVTGLSAGAQADHDLFGERHTCETVLHWTFRLPRTQEVRLFSLDEPDGLACDGAGS